MKKIFITGGTGFIGRNLTDHLLQKGWEVIVLIRSGSSINKNKNLHYVIGDVVSESWIDKVKGSDLLIHLAGIHGYIKMPFAKRLKVEMDGAKNISKASMKYNIPLIYVSTAYSDMNTDYAKAKNRAKKYIKKEIKKGLKAVIFCPVAVYGPGEDKNFSRIFKMASRGIFFIVGKGNAVLNLIYVIDLIEAFDVAIMNLEKLLGKEVIVSGSTSIKIKDLIDTYANLKSKKIYKIFLSVTPMKFLGKIFSSVSKMGIPVPFDSDTVTTLTRNQNYRLSPELKKIGFSPKVGLTEGLEKTLK